MENNETIQINVSEKLKKDATGIFNVMGIDMQTAVIMFLKVVVADRKLPFKANLPNKRIEKEKMCLASKICEELVEIMRQIPQGMVANNKDILEFLKKAHPERKIYPRILTAEQLNYVPWWRIVSVEGALTEYSGLKLSQQVELLENEGVSVVYDDDHECYVVEDLVEKMFTDFKA